MQVYKVNYKMVKLVFNSVILLNATSNQTINIGWHKQIKQYTSPLRRLCFLGAELLVEV